MLLNHHTNNHKSANVYFTLPITCQICLGKVKEPVVCPNLHAFCSICIDIWLEKSKQCPTCRVPISKENPCRKIVGGSDSKDDLLVPTEFSHSSTRKARYTALFQEYEDEITRLMKHIDHLTLEISCLKENNSDATRYLNGSKSAVDQHDLIQTLKFKLKQTQTNYDEIYKERDKLKEMNSKLESENSILLQDIQRLKTSVNEQKSQMTSRYTVAALEAKVENYEKEIKQLQKALQKSDKYISELESSYNIKKSSPIRSYNDGNSLQSTSTTMPTSSASNVSPMNGHSTSKTNGDQALKFIKGDNLTFKNELKIVKFSDKLETNHLVDKPQSTSQTNESSKQPHATISNDKFYGSPIKTPLKYSSTLPVEHQTKTIESFQDRLKKNFSFDLEVPSPITQSFNATSNGDNSMFTSNNLTMKSTSFDTLLHEPTIAAANAISQTHATNSYTNFDNGEVKTNRSDLLFSPMKRLRLEEFQFEKPKFNDDTFTSINNETINTEANNKKPALNGHHHHSDHNLLNNSMTPEFNDCLQLLNEAESKIQNRSSPYTPKYPQNSSSNTNNSSNLKSNLTQRNTNINANTNVNTATSLQISSGISNQLSDRPSSALPSKYFQMNGGSSTESKLLPSTTSTQSATTTNMKPLTENNKSVKFDSSQFQSNGGGGPSYSSTSTNAYKFQSTNLNGNYDQISSTNNYQSPSLKKSNSVEVNLNYRSPPSTTYTNGGGGSGGGGVYDKHSPTHMPPSMGAYTKSSYENHDLYGDTY